MKNGELDAIKDWDEQQAVILFHGQVYSRRPLLSEEGFFLSMCFDVTYLEDYNRTIRDKVAHEGIPSWAPKRRIVGTEVLKEALIHAISYDSYLPTTGKEKRFLLRRAEEWQIEHDCKPELIAKDDNRQLIFIGGPTPEGFRVDLVDLASLSMLYVYEPGEIDDPQLS